jgi:AcrR family transcriptional regulator
VATAGTRNQTAASGPRRARNRKGEGSRLRGDIVRAAAELLEETGSEDAVTLRAVARRVGISAPSIYGHFSDREAILDAVLTEGFAELSATVGRAVAASAGDAPGDASARLRAACRAYVAFGQGRPNHYRILFGRHRVEDTPTMTAPRPADELTGREAFTVLVDSVAGTGSSDPLRDATALWVALHGYVTLRASVPAFPWPPDDVLLSTLLDRLVGQLPDAPRQGTDAQGAQG